jgi:hypothetical protein
MARSAMLIMSLVMLLLTACAAQQKRSELVLAELVDLLAGSYDNIAQSRTDNEHPALRLMIAPVRAPLVGDHVFYVQEVAADDPRRVLAQRLYVVDTLPDAERAVLVQLDFTEPARWRDGHLNRDLFRSLLTQDLRQRMGCDLVFERSDKGFAALGDASRCRTVSRATGETLRVEQRITIDRDGLAIFDQHRDATGTMVYGGEHDPWYRYSRRADAPW